MKAPRWPLLLASALLALLGLSAVLAGPISSRLLQFGYSEVDAINALAPPGTPALPQSFRTLEPTPQGFDLLDRDRDGGVSWRAEPEAESEVMVANRRLEALQSAWLARARTSTQRRQGIELAEWTALTAALEDGWAARNWAGGAADPDEDGRVTLGELLELARPLALLPAEAEAHDLDGDGSLTPEEYPGAPQLRRHLLGTDSLGRDLGVRLAYGLRVSLLVALAAMAVSFLLGSLLGLACGYAGGLVDGLLLRLLEVAQAIPFIFVVILLSIAARELLELRALDPESQALSQALLLFAALGAVQWFSLARYARGIALSLRQAPFVKALAGMGFSSPRIVFGHLLPNALLPLSAHAVLLVPVLVLEEAFLSFLGFGIQPPYPSLGTLLGEAVRYLDLSGWLLAAPALTILALAWSFNIVGERLVAAFGAGREARR